MLSLCLQALVDAGAFITGALGRPTASRAAAAMLAKRAALERQKQREVQAQVEARQKAEQSRKSATETTA